MPPANNVHWDELQFHDEEESGSLLPITRIGTVSGSNRSSNNRRTTTHHPDNHGSTIVSSRYNNNDVVRRSVPSKNSKGETISFSPCSTILPCDITLSCTSSEDSSPSPPRRRGWKQSTTQRKRRRKKSYSCYGVSLSSFRIINALVWLLGLLAMLRYETRSQTKNMGLPILEDQGPKIPVDLVDNGLALFPANTTTASYLDYQSSRRLRAEQNSIAAAASANRVEETKDDQKIIHVIHTRFMQNQPDLLNLGLARLELFKEFTLRSLELQSSQNFLWVIRTDPGLNATLRQPLVEALSVMDNHLLLASNENPNVQIHNIINVNPEQVWSGDLERAKAYLQSESSPRKILESRLDADDGLHSEFVEYIQDHALDDLPDDKMSQWKIWCASRHIEWQYHSATDDYNTTEGILLSLKDSMCVSAGLTIAYTEGLKVHDLPPIKHEKLAHVLPSCSKHKLSCLDYIDLFPTALRARTPTSAGMLNVLLGRKDKVDKRYVKGAKKQETVQNQLWAIATPRFGFSKENASRLRAYVKDNLRSIAEDNLRGQCSSGHSCKKTSKSLLQSIIKNPEAFA